MDLTVEFDFGAPLPVLPAVLFVSNLFILPKSITSVKIETSTHPPPRSDPYTMNHLFKRFLLVSALLVSPFLAANVSASLIVVANHGFESNSGLASGINLGVNPTDLDANGSWGAGTSNSYGVLNDPLLARSGNNAYVINTEPGATGGGSFGLNRYDAPVGSFVGAMTFQVSAWVAQNPQDLISNGSNSDLHFEFYDGSGSLVFRTDTLGLQTFFPTGNDNGDSTPDYALVTHTYSFSDAINRGISLNNIASARALMSSWNGGGSGTGMFFVDDIMFSVMTPEPTSAALFGIGLAAIGIRRRRIR